MKRQDIKNEVVKWDVLSCRKFNVVIVGLLNVAMAFVFKISFLLIGRKLKYRVGIATSYKK